MSHSDPFVTISMQQMTDEVLHFTIGRYEQRLYYTEAEIADHQRETAQLQAYQKATLDTLEQLTAEKDRREKGSP